jgi:hypothetical protein
MRMRTILLLPATFSSHPRALQYVIVRRIDDNSRDSDSDNNDVKSFILFRCSAGKWGNIFRIFCSAKFHPLELKTSRGALIIAGS